MLRLYWLRLSDAPADDTLLTWLSDEERHRAAQFIAAPAARRFIGGRAALRRLLGAELGLAPQDVPLRIGRCGKPETAVGTAPAFNLAHSGEYVLIALTAGRSVGVDLEQLRPLDDAATLARRILTAAELCEWQHLPAAVRVPLLLQLWVAKEALIKCDGRGLTLDPAQIRVGLRLPHMQTVGLERQRLTLRQLPAPLGYRAACAVTGASHKSHRTTCQTQRCSW
jgi:4'-phosphopantetheinyl transferase